MSVIITGTGTDVGKTLLSSMIMAKYGGELSLKYWKPVQTGEIHDTDTVRSLTGLGNDHFAANSYQFRMPASPHFAAAREGQRISLDRINSDYEKIKNSNLVIEGAGGLYVPLNESEFMVDLIGRLELPVILVVSSLLGTINSSLLSLNALKSAGIEIAGFFMAGPVSEIFYNNIMTIETFSGTDFLGHCHLENESFAAEKFIEHSRNCFDGENKIRKLL